MMFLKYSLSPSFWVSIYSLCLGWDSYEKNQIAIDSIPSKSGEWQSFFNRKHFSAVIPAFGSQLFFTTFVIPAARRGG